MFTGTLYDLQLLEWGALREWRPSAFEVWSSQKYLPFGISRSVQYLWHLKYYAI